MSSLKLSSQKIIDRFIFLPICSILGSFVKRSNSPKKENIKNILIIKLWAAGDSIVLLPTLYALKKSFPNAKIHVLAHPRNRFVFEGHEFIDRIINFSALNILRNFRKYDVCIDAEPALSVSGVISFLMSGYRIGFGHGSRGKTYNQTVLFNKNQHMVQNYLDFARKVGVKYDTDELIPLHVSEHDKKAVDEFMKQNKLTNHDFIVGINPGVAESVKYRMWPLDRFAEVADEIIEKHHGKIILIDTKMNKNVIERMKSMMKNIPIDASDLKGMQLTELIRRCSIFIGNDSGFMHTSATEGVRTIGLFGPNTPKLWAPYGKHNISIFKPKHGCPFMDNTNPDLIPKHLTKEQMTCMEAITVKDVMNAVEKLRK